MGEHPVLTRGAEAAYRMEPAASAGGIGTILRSVTSRTRRILAAIPITLTAAVITLAFLDGARIVAPPRVVMLHSARAVTLIETAWEGDFARAGLRAGDIITGANGRPFAAGREFDRFMRTCRPGQDVAFDVVRDGRPLAATVTLSRNLGPRELIGIGVPVLVLFLLGAAVHLIRPEIPGARLFLAGCLAPAVLAAGRTSGYPVTPSASLVALAVLLFGALNGAIMAHFWVTFPERGPMQRRLIPLVVFAYLAAALIVGRVLQPAFAPGLEPMMPGAAGTRALLVLYEASVALCLVVVVISSIDSARRAATRCERRQMQALCGGAVVGLVSFLGLWVLPRAFGRPPLVGNIALTWLMLIMPVAVFFGIVFHRLFAIDVLARQRIVYGFVSAFIATVFVGVAAGAGALLAPRVEGAGLAWLAALAAVIAIVIHPLRSRAHQVVDRVLYRKRYDYRPALTEIAGRLAAMIDPGEAVLFVRLQLDRLLAPAWVDVLVRRGSGNDVARIAEDGTSAAFATGAGAADVLARLDESVAPFRPAAGTWPGGRDPALVAVMRSGEAVAGALVLGPRRVDVPYRLEDEDFVRTLASITGAVLDRGRLAEERSQRERLALVGSATAAVVHEMKNPLAAIKSAVAVLRRRIGDDRRSDELAGIVEKEIDRLQDTILGVLSYVRPQTGPAVAVSLGDTLRPLISVVDADFRAAGVEVELATIGTEALVAADPGHLRQMLLNLLLNAREAMPAGGRIEVSADPWKTGDGSEAGVDVLVRDTGPGFTHEALARACEPFFSTKRLGTGLGLANVKRLAEAHGGALLLANRAEGGAEVRLRLRAAQIGAGRERREGRTV